MTIQNNVIEIRERRNDILELPSGADFELSKPDFTLCADIDDLQEVLFAASARAIDIEKQLGLYEVGLHPNGDQITPNYPVEPHWHPRAKAALRYAQLLKGEAQTRIQRANQKAKIKPAPTWQSSVDRSFVDVAKARLPQDIFQELIAIAVRMAETAATKLAESTAS